MQVIFKEVYAIEEEMEDRFGKPDIFTKQFIELIIIKILALNLKSKILVLMRWISHLPKPMIQKRL